ncbi:hypothetical protein DKX38_024769 [Salix brachista]|uniref:Sodium/sulfate symporter n=1 Tax=Salix brachista TaxID=2182728 RepID=A0A5N5JSK9_9ROSI|nr:hypothetical protein DKX38_024769 [Salix brachista]
MSSFALTFSSLSFNSHACLKPFSLSRLRSTSQNPLPSRPNLPKLSTVSPLLPKLSKSSVSSTTRGFSNFTVKASSASSAPASNTSASLPWQGAAIKPLLASIATSVILWFVPVPSGVTKPAWQLLAIFLGTIVGIITQPLPLGAVGLMGLGASVLTKTLIFTAAFSVFGDPIPWLIALAFFFAHGFIKTGLGNQIAYQFVSLFGSSSLGLGYSLVFSEALLAPAIPSVSARAGGIFLPLVKSLCVACGSNVGDGTEHKLGSWLMLTCFQTSVISSSMFLTAMVANPLSATLTFNTIQQTIGWTDWAKAAIVSGLISLIVVPLILYLIYPPTVKSSPDAPILAREKLEKMGPMTTNEIIMAGTLFLTVGLWVFGGMLNVDAVTAAILGLSIILITGVVTWKECLAESVAWDTLTWFAALIAMAGYLNKYGLISWFSQTVVKVFEKRLFVSMDVTFREFEPYYTLEVNSPFDDSPDTSGMRREGESRSSDGERQVHVPCTVVVEESVEEPEDEEEEIEPERSETQAQGELRMYTRRRRQNDVEVPVVPVVLASPLSWPTPTPETPTPSTSDSNYTGDMIPLPSPDPTILRRTSRSNAGHPPDRFGFSHDIAQFVSYSNITLPVHEAFITSLDTVSIPKS